MEAPTNRSQAIEEDILRSNPAAVIVRTDGNGQPIRKLGRGHDASALARELDVSALMLRAIGDRQQLGEAESLVMAFRDGLIAVGRLPDGGQLGVVVDRNTTVGLLISYLNRLLAAEAA